MIHLVLLYSWRFSRYSAPIHWLVHGHMTSSNEIRFPPNAMSGQHCENYDVKRETVHCYPRNVDRCCTSISARFSKSAFVLFCYITNNLMTGPLGNNEFCFSRISVFPETRNKIHCSPRDQSLSVKCRVTVATLDRRVTEKNWTEVNFLRINILLQSYKGA